VLGWAYGKRKDVALTLRAMDRAVRYRKPRRGLIFHTRASFSPACAGGEDRMVPSVARKERRVSFKRDERMSRGDNPVAPR
jgi:hypothetical protein